MCSIVLRSVNLHSNTVGMENAIIKRIITTVVNTRYITIGDLHVFISAKFRIGIYPDAAPTILNMHIGDKKSLLHVCASAILIDTRGGKVFDKHVAYTAICGNPRIAAAFIILDTVPRAC